MTSAAPAALAATTVPQTVTFSTSDVAGGFTTWTVPAGVTSLTITAVGANGGPSAFLPAGGLGAFVQAVVSVTPGTDLTIAVGSAGTPGAGGVPGGGGTIFGSDSSGGGGFSGVRLADLTPLVIAGAGGGAGVAAGGDAGAPGGSVGAAGGGQAGTLVAGGAGGTVDPGGAPGSAGSAYQGGSGDGGTGAGGGGGFFGGGGGGTYFFGGGGGGGSSFPDAGALGVITSTLKAPSDPVDGSVTIEYVLPAWEVGFDVDGGSPAPAVQAVLVGDAAVEPTVPTRADSTFVGWYTDPVAGTLWDFQASVPSDLTLFARWSAIPQQVPDTEPGGLPATGAVISPLLPFGAVGAAVCGLGILLLARRLDTGRTRRRGR
jgi:uncharacterized repeat protein (TIGR02543 family)